MDLGSDACDRTECVALRKENAELKKLLDLDHRYPNPLRNEKLETVARAAEEARLSHVCFTYGCPHAPIAGACGHDEKRDMKRLGEALAALKKTS